eukprot:CAMPEP_0119007260 /NCGR_PEP_ID=MMETSP1176-20130426/2895_1 /TAXON_ID=265551 /ORGANISM="Synedropsis recta cf, Strain CCMP1620" /LENGTH=181 /DNA_ID=CAMNT_0006959375 /DNA_START=73 /DNA_END=618 /DNA_ORIENTATION=-
MTKYVARNHRSKTMGPLEPQCYLDVEITSIQKDLLNPSMEDLITGRLIQETMGEDAKKKISARRLDFISGNVASYANVLNSATQLEAVKYHLLLKAAIAGVNATNDMDIIRKAEEKQKAEAEKAARKETEACAFQQRRIKLLPELQGQVAKGQAHVLKLTNPQLRDVLIYFFRHSKKGVAS